MWNVICLLTMILKICFYEKCIKYHVKHIGNYDNQRVSLEKYYLPWTMPTVVQVVCQSDSLDP